VLDGAAERFGLLDDDLALCCASHSSAPDQVERVRLLLAKVGAAEADLVCGPHRPLADDVAADYRRRGVRLGPVHSNCSGKHAGMLALARHRGWPLAGYAERDHPVQRRCLEEVARRTGVAEQAIALGTDGCGVVTFALPLRNLAAAWARLGSEERRAGRSGAVPTDASLKTEPSGPAPGSPLRSLVPAMLRHPDLLSGPGRPCSEMMHAHPGKLVAKVGAEGVYAALLVDGPLGVALKVEDGHAASAVLAVVAVLDALGLPGPEALRHRPLTNSRGAVVGELRVTGGLSR
jgi:L-asparaginase II